MEIPKGAKFLFIVVPILLVAIVLILVYMGKDRDTTKLTENDLDDISNGKEVVELMDFDTLEIETTKEGQGPGAVAGDTVVVHYVGTLKSGTQFDSSYFRDQPFEFTLGEGEVITGWEEGIKGMKVGEERTLRIPSSMGYGSDDSNTIPANS